MSDSLRQELITRLSLVRSRLVSMVPDNESEMVSAAFSQLSAVLNFADSYFKGELEEFVAEDLLMQMKLGRALPHRQVIDKYGRAILEEFQHFVRINSIIPPVKPAPQRKEETASSKYEVAYGVKELPPPDEDLDYEDLAYDEEESDDGNLDSRKRPLGTAHYDEARHSKKRKFERISGGPPKGSSSNVGPIKKKKKPNGYLNFK